MFLSYPPESEILATAIYLEILPYEDNAHRVAICTQATFYPSNGNKGVRSKAVASLIVQGVQELHFSHSFLILSSLFSHSFLIFPQTFPIFFLILAL